NAGFGPFTDTYALAGTLYHLLTGQLPVPVTDRAAGQALPPPQKFNSGLSQAVNDAVVWAMEMQVDKRPQSVREFTDALTRGTNRGRKNFWSKGRLSGSLIAVGCFGVLALAFWPDGRSPEPNKRPQDAVEPRAPFGDQKNQRRVEEPKANLPVK